MALFLRWSIQYSTIIETFGEFLLLLYYFCSLKVGSFVGNKSDYS